MQILLWSTLFVISLASLIVVADFFIRSAERVGLALGIPSFIIGVTIVALGTSLPELVTSIIAVYENTSELVTGNVIGSNIANICLVMGITGVFAKSRKLGFDMMKLDLPMLIFTVFFLGVCIWDYQFTFWEGILSVLILAGYLAIIFRNGKGGELVDEDGEEAPIIPFSWKEPIVLIISAFCIYLSAKYLVESINRLSGLLDIGTAFIGLTLVAVGTSLPELVVSIVAAKKGQTEMAIGNVLGSNVFNILAVMGIPSLIGPLKVPKELLQFSLPIVVAVSLIAFFVIQDHYLKKWEGILLLALYAIFLYGSLALEF